MSTLLQSLTEHPFLQGIADRHLKRLADFASVVEFKENDTVFREGEDAKAFYLIQQGRVRLVINVPPSESVIVDVLGEGDAMGWSWLTPPYQWHFDAMASEDAVATALDGEMLRNYCDEDHDLGYELVKRSLQVVEKRLMSTRIRLTDMYDWS